MSGEKCLGYVQIVDLANYENDHGRDKPPLKIKAHENSLNIIELNNDGTILATSSERGTLIRLFETREGKLLQELRRGSDKVNIFSLSFSFHDSWLCCIGDSGTLHIFSVNTGKKEASVAAKNKAKNANTKNSKSMLGKLGLGAIFTYFDSEFNFAHYKNNYDSLTKCIFQDTEDKILLISYKGDCCKLSFDHDNGGECKPELNGNILAQSSLNDK